MRFLIGALIGLFLAGCNCTNNHVCAGKCECKASCGKNCKCVKCVCTKCKS